MSRHQTRKEHRKFYHSWFFLLPLVFVLGLFVRGAYASFEKKQQASAEQEKYEQKVLDLEIKKKDLEEKIERLETERGKEEELRKRFNVVQEGETMIRIVE